MQLYHGSNAVVKEPRLIEQTRGLDFGPGFYLTTSEKQAARFSEIIVNRRGGRAAIVNVYELDMITANETLNVLQFAGADAEWLSYVSANRLRSYQGQEYDIVIGAVANDTVIPTIQAFLGGFLNEEATILTLKTSKLVDQMCFKTHRALTMLKYIRSYDTKGGDIIGS